MAHTPPNSGLSGLLRGINNGPNLLSRVAHGSVQNDLESTDNSASFLDSDNFGDAGQFSTPVATAPAAADSTNDNGSKTMAPNSQKKKAPSKKKAGKRKRNDDPSDDPAVPTVPNPLEMSEAFDDGYDSDGWKGLVTGVDPNELLECKEKEVEEDKTVASAPELSEPTFIDIPLDDLMSLQVKDLKHELAIWNVTLPKDRRKPSLQERLKEALANGALVHPAADQGIHGEDDMADFAVRAKWVELAADVDVEE